MCLRDRDCRGCGSPPVERRLLPFLVCLALGRGVVSQGCKGSKSSEASGRLNSVESPSQDAGSTNTILRLHWIGKRELTSQSRATNLMALWNRLPSQRLEEQT